jgi:2-C-methyl-D-erythritol 4-phosphate cytidylyltransferase
MSVAPRLHLLVPAAGTGTRAGTELPNQYQALAGSPMVLHTLRALARVKQAHSLGVVVSPGDTRMAEVIQREVALNQVHIWPVGGATRAASVAAGLKALLGQGADLEDWVLVHDAARCLIQPEWVSTLIERCQHDAVGGLLAIPLPDTLKQAAPDSRSQATLSRDDKWLAQTPQMFRLGMLSQALMQAGTGVTDEASAIEAMGLKPLLVQGSALNFKVTYPEDLRLAAWVLAAREEEPT